MVSRERWLIEEAETWRRQGRVDDEFVAYVKEEYGGEESEVLTLQHILYVVGGVILFLGIFFAFSQFWDQMSDGAKFTLLVFLSVVAYGVGGVLEAVRRWPALAAIGLGVGGGLLLFALTYVSDDGMGLTAAETAALVVAFAAAAATLAYGHVRLPALGAVGVVLLYLSFFLTASLHENLGEGGMDALSASAFLVGSALLLANFVLWLAHTRMKDAWARRLDPAGTRAAGLMASVALVPALLVFMFQVVEIDDTWGGIAALGVYAGVLMAGGIAARYPELVAVGGLALVGDAVWAGADKGDVLGTAAALVGAAIAIIALAQSGLLRRWLRPPTVSYK